MEICQMDALISVNNHTEVLQSHCIGCGNCLNVCDNEAITLMRKEKEIIPPKNSTDMYRKMVIERYGAFGSLRLMGKALLGKKI